MPAVSEIFRAMPGQLESQDISDLNATVQFDLSGDEGGSWVAVIQNGKADVSEGTADNPTASIKMDAQDFKAMVSGELNAVSAFMSGKVKVDGDMGVVMKLSSMFG